MSKIETFKKLMDSSFKQGNKRQLSFLTKAAKEAGVKIPKYITSAKATERQMNSFASKIMKAIKGSGVNTSIIPKLEKAVNRLNKTVKETGNYRKLNDYIRKSKGSGTELMQLNAILFYDKDKNKFTTKDLLKIAKKKNMTPMDFINSINQKIDNLSFTNDLKDILGFYGFKTNEIKRIKDLYNGANIKQKDYMLKVFGDFGKGVRKYNDQTLASQFGTKELLQDKVQQILVDGISFKNGIIEFLKEDKNNGKYNNNYNKR